MLRSGRAVVIFIGVIFVLLGVMTSPAVRQLALFADDTQKDRFPAPVASGADGGRYYAFTEILTSQSNGQLLNYASKGSVENIALLQNRTVDFALVQNDTAQNAYFGNRGRSRYEELRYVAPVFVEYVQIVVPAKSNVKVLSDLRGKQVCIGSSGSGTFWNARDILSIAQLQESVDFEPVLLSADDCIKGIEDKENYAAFFTTSQEIFVTANPGYRQLMLSDQITSELIRKANYFRKPDTASRAAAMQQLEVETFLATRDDVPEFEVDLVKSIFNRAHPRLQEAGFTPLSTPQMEEEFFFQSGIQLHSGATDYSVMRDRSIIYFTIFAIIALLSIWCHWYQANNYNRHGQARSFRWPANWIVLAFSKIAPVMFVVAIFLAVVAGFMVILFWTEDVYAEQNATISPFANMSISDAIVWLSAYISSGFNAAIYPESRIGKAIIATLAVIMAVAPFAAILKVFEGLAKRREANLRGLGVSHHRDHVLLCGWNEKAPGIVYALTSNEIDRRRHVTIIAELKEAEPISAFNFNKHYVDYIRGNAANLKDLERAKVGSAQSALVLADFGADESADSSLWNRSCILATFNVESKQPAAHICAEMEYLRGLPYYQASGANALVHPNTVVTRMTAIAIVDRLLLDYVIDMVSYHDFDEIYSIRASQLLQSRWQRGLASIRRRAEADHRIARAVHPLMARWAPPLQPTDLGEVRAKRLEFPVNILGSFRKAATDCLSPGAAELADRNLYNAQFGEGSQLIVRDAVPLQLGCNGQSDDYILYSAKRDHSITTKSPLISGLRAFGGLTLRRDLDGLFKLVMRRTLRHGLMWLRWKRLFRGKPSVISDQGTAQPSSQSTASRRTSKRRAIPSQKILIVFDAQSDSVNSKPAKSQPIDSMTQFQLDLRDQLGKYRWCRYRVEFCYENDLPQIWATIQDYDKIIIMTTPHIRSRSSSMDQVNAVDTGLILLTKSVYDKLSVALRRAGRDDCHAKDRIVTELLNFDNRALLTKAGAGDELPSSLMVGRFMANQAVNANHSTDFLMAVMSMSDGTHLYMHEVGEDDPAFSGLWYSDALHNQPATQGPLAEGIQSYRLLAWLPAEEAEQRRLSNRTHEDDETTGNAVPEYAHHFVTVLDYRFPDRPIAVGDRLILLIEQESRTAPK